MTLHINASLLASIKESALASSPEECCGFLIGRSNGADHTVERVDFAENVAEGDRRKRYEIDPQIAFDAMRNARNAGEEIVGIFHSHPDGTLTPSSHDIRTAWPHKSYLIVGIDGQSVVGVRSHRSSSTGAEMSEEPIEVR